MESIPASDERDLDWVLERFLGVGRNAPVERRGAPRSNYEVPIASAPYDAVHFPAADEFVIVQGINISTSGVSYLADERPPAELVVLRLGSLADRTVFASARVVRVDVDRPKYGPCFVVGCQFVARLTPPAEPS